MIEESFAVFSCLATNRTIKNTSEYQILVSKSISNNIFQDLVEQTAKKFILIRLQTTWNDIRGSNSSKIVLNIEAGLFPLDEEKTTQLHFTSKHPFHFTKQPIYLPFTTQ